MLILIGRLVIFCKCIKFSLCKEMQIFNKFAFIMKLIRNIFTICFFVIALNLPAQTEQDTIRYIFMGHCYQLGAGSNVDYRLEQLDYSNFEGVWLGGDVCITSMLDYSTVQYLNNLFDLANPETHWALGNHDARLGNLEWYEEITNRETYFAYSSYGITRIVMNTNLVPTNCEMIDEQYEIISNVCDTISESNYLILIMHHGIWRGVPSLPNPIVIGHSDLVYWNSNCYDVNSTFVNSIYPKLLEVKNKGIDVICVYGDMGAQQKTFRMDSDDGIHFLGCGLNNNEPDDAVLIFNYIKQTGMLEYDFHNLDSLYYAR